MLDRSNSLTTTLGGVVILITRAASGSLRLSSKTADQVPTCLGAPTDGLLKLRSSVSRSCGATSRPNMTDVAAVPNEHGGYQIVSEIYFVPTNSVSLHTARKTFIYLLTYLLFEIIIVGEFASNELRRANLYSAASLKQSTLSVLESRQNVFYR